MNTIELQSNPAASEPNAEALDDMIFGKALDRFREWNDPVDPAPTENAYTSGYEQGYKDAPSSAPAAATPNAGQFPPKDEAPPTPIGWLRILTVLADLAYYQEYGFSFGGASSTIQGLAYDPDLGILYVGFKSGQIYAYANVPQTVFDRFAQAGETKESLGELHHRLIKKADPPYPYLRLSAPDTAPPNKTSSARD